MNLDRNKPLRQGIVGWITARTSTYYLPKASCQCYECVLLQCIITNALPLQRNLVTWCQMLERTCQTLPASGESSKKRSTIWVLFMFFLTVIVKHDLAIALMQNLLAMLMRGRRHSKDTTGAEMGGSWHSDKILWEKWISFVHVKEMDLCRLYFLDKSW